MSAVLIIAIATVLFAAFLSLYFAARHAVDGYEDERGFHIGAGPWAAASLSQAVNVGIEGVAEDCGSSAGVNADQPVKVKPIEVF